jgi:hypothetical protein
MPKDKQVHNFEVPTVSLHVHERIDPKTIIESVKKEVDWVKAVNSQASFGKWRYAVAYQREEIDDILEKGLWEGGPTQ